MALSLELIDDIKRKADIVKVISSYIPVIKKGNNYVALCPFHHDNNPSMQINPAKQIFKCFVCGTGGNVFGFVQKYENISFIQALKKVCQICSIEIPDAIKYQGNVVRENEKELQALDKLATYYSYMLKTNEGKAAKDYITNRGLDEDIIKKFRLGYAPLDNTLSINYLREKEKIDVATLDSAGITSSSSTGFKDRYRDRLMFPLSDLKGNLVGFSGRRFREGNTDAKYVNSPDSIVFHKSEILYNLNNALPAIKKNKYVYVLEGFMDVIALYRAGIEGAVGLMGTALTKEHIAFFKKVGAEIRLSLDADEPGQFATQKCLLLLQNSGLNVEVVKPLEGGKDADELLKSQGQEALVKAMNTLELPIIHAMNYSLSHNELNTYEDKEKFLFTYLSYYKKAPSLAKGEMLKALSTGLNVSSDAIESYFTKEGTYLTSPKKEIYVSTDVEKVSPHLEREEINNSLFNFIKTRINSDMQKRAYALALFRNEGQLISRIPLSVKAFELFEKKREIFYLRPYQEVYLLLDEYYSSLRDGVECISEGDFDSLQGLVEENYGEKVGSLVSKGKTEEAKKTQNEGDAVIQVIQRLKICKYPNNKEFDQESFEKLLNDHSYDLYIFETNLSCKPGGEAKTLANLATLDNWYKSKGK